MLFLYHKNKIRKYNFCFFYKSYFYNDGILFFIRKLPENSSQDILFLTKKSQKYILKNEIKFINNEEDKINQSSIISIEKLLNGDNNYYNIE